MNTNRTERWGCLYLIKTGDQYWLRTLCATDRPTPERISQIPESGELVHVVYTDNVPYIKEKLSKRFAWEAVDSRHYKLSDVDVDYVQRISNQPPLKVLRVLLPNISYSMLYSTYQGLQNLLGKTQHAVAS